MKHTIGVILSFALLLTFISLVHAGDEEETVNLGDFPVKLAEAFNIDIFAGQLLASLIFMSLFLFPSMLIAGYFGGSGAILYTVIFVGMGTSGVCVALGWLPVWIFLVECLLIALLFADRMRQLITGGTTGG